MLSKLNAVFLLFCSVRGKMRLPDCRYTQLHDQEVDIAQGNGHVHIEKQRSCDHIETAVPSELPSNIG